MKHTLYIIICIALLTVSCDGRQGNAETAVEEFMAANLNNAKGMKITGFSQLDSTQKIKDSTLTMIRHNAENNGRYKKGLTYASPSARNMLCILRRGISSRCRRPKTSLINLAIESVLQ